MVCFLLGILLSVSATNTLEIASFDFDTTGSTVGWNGTLGKIYTVMITDDLMSNSWQTAANGTNANCQSIVTAAEDGELEYIEQDGDAGTNRFYKIVTDDAPAFMVLIPGGTNSGIDSDSDLGPYSLTVASFYMDRREVTKARWNTVYNWAITNGYSFDNSGSGKAVNHPIQTVNWYDCVKWCNARSEMDGRTPCYNLSDWSFTTSTNGYRLPTSDEWEYAARGGLSSKRFPWGVAITHNQANYDSDSSDSYDISLTRGYHPTYNDGVYPYTSPVGSFAPNDYGLYDMSGNVWEWCNTADGQYRDVRGGSWDKHADDLRCGDHGLYGDPLNNSDDDIGFRSVCH